VLTGLLLLVFGSSLTLAVREWIGRRRRRRVELAQRRLRVLARKCPRQGRP
jgi:hypothetical protein